jgi:hypothetical protein
MKNLTLFFLLLILSILFSCKQKDQQKLSFQTINGSIQMAELHQDKMNSFVFLAPGCPLSEASILELNRLDSLYSINQYSTTIIIPGNLYSVQEIEEFKNIFNIKFRMVIDTNYYLTKLLNASITPEYFLVNENMVVLYQGAIDNKALDNDIIRQEADMNFAEIAIRSIIENKKIELTKTKAVGCFIEQ